MDNTEFPMIFGLKGKSFEWVFHNKTEFVDFTLTEMNSPTGLWKIWQKYCKDKINTHGSPNRSKKRVEDL